MVCIRRFLWIALLGLLAGCASAGDARRADALRELGLSYLHEGNHEAAIRQLLEARELNPRDAKVRHELGLAFFAKDLKAEAEKEFLAAIRYDPKLTEARLNLGTLYVAQERWAEAEVHLRQVTTDYLYRSPARAYNNLGWVYYKQGRPADALAEYEKALKIAPMFCQAMHNAALIYEDRKEPESAVLYQERAVNACPEDLRYRFRLGVTQARLERKDDALKNLELVANGDTAGALGAEAREYMRTLRSRGD